MDFKVFGSLGNEATIGKFEKYFEEELLFHDTNKKQITCKSVSIKETLNYLLEELDSGVAGILRISNVRRIVTFLVKKLNNVLQSEVTAMLGPNSDVDYLLYFQMMNNNYKEQNIKCEGETFFTVEEYIDLANTILRRIKKHSFLDAEFELRLELYQVLKGKNCLKEAAEVLSLLDVNKFPSSSPKTTNSTNTSDMQMENTDDQGEEDTVTMGPIEKADIWITCAELYIGADSPTEAEVFVGKARLMMDHIKGTSLSISDVVTERKEDNFNSSTFCVENNVPNETQLKHSLFSQEELEGYEIGLRFRLIDAKCSDANRDFANAAFRYYELSKTVLVEIPKHEIYEFLLSAITCAILAPSSRQRDRVLCILFRDERIHINEPKDIPFLSSLFGSISENTIKNTSEKINVGHTIQAKILNKICRGILLSKKEIIELEKTLQSHQKLILAEGWTIPKRVLIEHNMSCVSMLYNNIYFTELALLLDLDLKQTEKLAAKLITKEKEASESNLSNTEGSSSGNSGLGGEGNKVKGGRLQGRINQVQGILYFQSEKDPLSAWDDRISHTCIAINTLDDHVENLISNETKQIDTGGQNDNYQSCTPNAKKKKMNDHDIECNTNDENSMLMD